MSEKSQDYKVEVLSNNGRPIVLRPDLSIKDAIYWANRVQDFGERAYITMSKLAEQKGVDTIGLKAIEWTEVE